MENQGVTFPPFQIVNTLYEEEGEHVLFWTIVTCPDLQENINCQSVLYSSPSYQTEDGNNVDVSNLINVKIKNNEDEDLLYNMARNNGVVVLGKNRFMPLWFTLSCTNESSGDAVFIAKLLHESKLFAQVMPDILVHNLLFCSYDEYFSEQWGLNNSGQYSGVAGIDIKYCETKEITTGSSNIVVSRKQPLNLILVLFNKDVTFQFQRRSELAGLDGPLVVHQQETFHLFSVTKEFVVLIDNLLVLFLKKLRSKNNYLIFPVHNCVHSYLDKQYYYL